MKLWGGRFNKEASDILDKFNNSISFDYILYPYDILGSIAHVKMLDKVGIIENREKEKIINGLDKIKLMFDNDEFDIKISDEDIHMAIEKKLIEIVGDVGKKMHTGRSRNDQIALDMKLYSRDKIKKIQDKIEVLLDVLIELSEENTKTYMPGYTHLQGAQIISLGFYFQSYFQKFKRDYQRLKDLYKHVNIMPLGAGALAGVNYETDRFYIASQLGFDGITENALDSVSDRDYILDFLNIISILFIHLSRFCEEIIIFSSQEYSFFQVDDAYATGSSIMPQKRNPDVAELIRGKSGKVISNLVGLLTTMKGLPLAYNKDMQEDKKYLFSSTEISLEVLTIFSEMLNTLKFNKKRMKEACYNGYLQATDLADYLVKKGLPFREAHEVIGKIVSELEENGKTFQDLNIDEFKKYNSYFDDKVIEILKLDYSVNMKKSYGSTSEENVKKMIKNAKSFMKE